MTSSFQRFGKKRLIAGNNVALKKINERSNIDSKASNFSDRVMKSYLK